MSERPLIDELQALAEQIVAGPDDIADLAADAAAVYRRERMIALGMIGVEQMLAREEAVIDEEHHLLVACRERLRDRLRSLLAWARETGRMA